MEKDIYMITTQSEHSGASICTNHKGEYIIEFDSKCCSPIASFETKEEAEQGF